jgi:hypothetical protein
MGLTNGDEPNDLVPVGKRRAVRVGDHTRKIMLCGVRSLRQHLRQRTHDFPPSVKRPLYQTKTSCQNEKQRRRGGTYIGLSAAARTLTSTSPCFGFGTGTSVLSTSASRGLPCFTTIHAFCVVGIALSEDIQGSRMSASQCKSSVILRC